MRLVIGGAWQGKTEYVKNHYHIEEADIWQGGYPVPACRGETYPAAESGPGWDPEIRWRCINGLHNIIRAMLETGSPFQSDGEYAFPPNPVSEVQREQSYVNYITNYFLTLCRQNPDLILICDEVGNGIVPVEKSERDYRECVGRVLCMLAKEADSVERVQCGIPHRIKQTVYITFIRHGATVGNLKKRYIGITDEPLCEEGRRKLLAKKNAGVYPKVKRVIVSPLKRCVETAEILYPNVIPEVYSEFRETDFGLFEGKSYEELMQDEKLCPLYQEWIDSGGILSFPEGESMEETKTRCVGEFDRFLTNLTSDAVVITHGGTIMSILQMYTASAGDFYEHQCDNGGGYLCRVELTGDGRLYQMKVEKKIV
jgi:alpha-ribazole phosphatase